MKTVFIKGNSSELDMHIRGAGLKGNQSSGVPKGAFGTPNKIPHNFGLIGLYMNYSPASQSFEAVLIKAEKSKF